ncbi:MAG TPA: cytochrome c oxidase subunit II [Gemmatimonadales bacterium]|nr:cytochrome c oxidase subunit II [Gemmatimonadales bacterium]
MIQFPGQHSAHAPAGPQAQLLDRLGDLLYLISAVVFVLVVVALLAAIFRRRGEGESPEEPARERRMAMAVAVAAGATAATLVTVLLLSFGTGRQLAATPSPEALQVRVTGRQWWWEVEYRDSVANRWATTANEIHVPVGRPVVFELRGGDVIHSFWVPNLGVKRDMIPGQETSIWFQADTPGVYRGQCAEFCGHQHAKMAFLVVVEPPGQFTAWLERQRDTARTPTDSLGRRGQEVFLSSSCVMCHAVAGTPAGSRVGPDLTHLAARRTIGAGTLPNTRGHLAGWIVDPQQIKPGVRMPPNALDPQDLQALLAYLATLR